MTPASPTGSKSGSSNLSVKQQRAEARARKLEEYQRQQKRMARNRRIAIASSIAAVVVIVGLVIVSVVLTPQKARYSAGGEGAKIAGVKTFENTASHVETPVTYPQTPPAGGEHNPIWLNCGIYDQPVPNENAVHAQEHGAIWVTYDPKLSDKELDTLKQKLPSTYVILSPFDGLPAPIVLSGWNTQLQVKSADDKRIQSYMEEYWQSQSVPEPGSPCIGGLDAPGKVS